MTRNFHQRRLTVAALAALPLHALARSMTPRPPYSETASVASRDGRVLVTLQFDNPGPAQVWIPVARAEDEDLFGRLFEIRSADGAEVPYIGIKVKRGPLTAEDFRALPPRTRHAHTIDITPSYDFLHGTHAYTLAYDAVYLTDPRRPEHLSTLGTVRAAFTHARA